MRFAMPVEHLNVHDLERLASLLQALMVIDELDRNQEWTHTQRNAFAALRSKIYEQIATRFLATSDATTIKDFLNDLPF